MLPGVDGHAPGAGGGVELILASTSPYRRALMERLGLPFRCVAPRFEERVGRAGEDPGNLVVHNALGKALSILDAHPGSLIVGSDQVAECAGEILPKPGSAPRAVEQLLRLSGREHRLLTGVAVVQAPRADAPPPGELPGRTALVVNHLRLRELSRAEAETYVRRESPLNCAGAYKSEGLGIVLFEHLRGDDPTAIVGLPLIALGRLLRAFGCDPLGE